MDGYIYEDTEVLERRIREMMTGQALPMEVVGYDVEFGNHMDGGDPAVWINLHIPSSIGADHAAAQRIADLLITLTPMLANAVPGRAAAIRMHRPPVEADRMSVRAHT